MFFASMVLGALGLIGMALLGWNHGASHGSGHGHSGHSHGGNHAGGHSHHHAPHQHAAGRGTHGSSLSKWLLLVSPRVFFSLALGFGAAGLVLERFFKPLPAVVLAALGAWLLEHYLVTPYWNLLLGFASRPAGTLDGLVRAKAWATMPFDSSGSGLIRLELDGQVRQVLGILRPEERGQPVQSGDALRVEAVDEAGNCTVSRLL